MALFTANPKVKAQCDRCGFIYRQHELYKEWTGFKVCLDCLDPKTKQEFPGPIDADSSTVREPRPRNDKTVNSGEAVTALDFIPRSWRVGAGICKTGQVLVV